MLQKLWRNDPRFYQIAILTTLLIYGIGWLHFEVTVTSALLIVTTALFTQYVSTRFFKLLHFEIHSALISSLSLCLLLRTDDGMLMSLTAVVSILSKFLLRWRGKHLFNPTNFGLISMMLLTGQIWVSPGQWGNTVFFSLLIACLGGLVIQRAARSDITIAFLIFYALVLLSRAWWLGDPITIPWHQLQNGAFLIFAFFMISDPKTTPDSRSGRILFAFLVAIGASFVQFYLFRTNGLLWSLAFFSLLVPILDKFLPGTRYEWRT